MSGLSLNERVHTLLCPNCKKYISSDATSCRFCGMEIDEDLMQHGVAQETEEIRKTNFAFHRNFMVSGFAFLAIGVSLLAQVIVTGRFFFYSPVLVLLGLGQVIYGGIGMYGERKK
jgi:uncharacterized membrane protein YvbJ